MILFQSCSARNTQSAVAGLVVVALRLSRRLWVKLGRAGDVRCMTDLPPKADVHPRSCYVAFVPNPDLCSTAKNTYSITSSANASIADGIIRPSPLAVFWLITSRKFAGCPPEDHGSWLP